jgi:hypothetical protein
MVDVPRGKYLGKRVGGEPDDEAEHFIRCPACGWIDCRDLGAVFDHEGPLLHPTSDQPRMPWHALAASPPPTAS